MRSWMVCFWCFGLVFPAAAQEFRLLAWNVESNRPNQPAVSDELVIAEQLTELMRDPATRSELICLTEVEPRTALRFRQAIATGLGSPVDSVTSASGGFQDTDSLLLVVDQTRFRIEEAQEIHRYAGIAANFNVTESDSEDFGALRARSPLAVRLTDRQLGLTFWLIVNHLARGEADLRTDQAKLLRQWALDHPVPIITAGDFNFDYEFASGQGNAGYQAMIEGNVWQWLKPDPLVDSNWADDRNAPAGQRVDRYPNSILDFVWVANHARQWQGEADVVVRPGDFPDNERTSDHRPLIATFRPQ